jgi:hypothetical protein
MTRSYSFERLDCEEKSAREAYERAFFASFERVTSNRLVHELWMWDHAGRRLATRIPYCDQMVFVLRDDSGGVQAALAVNVAMKSFQSAAFGFTPPSDTAGCFEVLTFFCVSDHRLGVTLSLWTQCLEVFKSAGYHTGFASTARRPLVMYRRIDWKQIGIATILDEERFFLKYRIES